MANRHPPAKAFEAGNSSTAVKKFSNPKEVPPKQKYVRACAIDSYKNNGIAPVFRELVRRPLEQHAIVCYKSCTAMHQILQDGHPNSLIQSWQQKSIFSALRNVWSRSQDPYYGKLNAVYSNFLLDKIGFHHQHPEFSGNLDPMAYKQSVRKSQNQNSSSGAGKIRTDDESLLQRATHLLDLQDSIVVLTKHVIAATKQGMTDCKVAPLVHCVVESFNVYTLLTMFLGKLAEDGMDDMFSYLAERYYAQYGSLRRFYAEASTIRYVASVVTVPNLPADPPQFGRDPSKRRKKKEKKPSPMPSPRQSPNLANANMGGGFQSTIDLMGSTSPQVNTASARRNTVAAPSANTNFASFGSVQEPMPMMATVAAGPGGWVTFGDAPEPNVAVTTVQPSSQELLVTASKSTSSTQSETDNEVAELKKEIAKLKKMLVEEKEKSGALEKKLRAMENMLKTDQKTAESWKQERVQLLQAQQSMSEKMQKAKTVMQAWQGERQKLLENNQALDAKVKRMIKAYQLDKKQRFAAELSAAEALLEEALYEMDAPTIRGNEKASLDDVLSAATDLLPLEDDLIAAVTERKPLTVPCRQLSNTTKQLLSDAKGAVVSLAEAKDEGGVLGQKLLSATRHCGVLVLGGLSATYDAPTDVTVCTSQADAVRAAVSEIKACVKNIVEYDETKRLEDEANLDGNAQQLLTDAEKELMSVAKIVEDAAAFLLKMKEAASQKEGASEMDLAVSDAILSAALAITQATQHLVKQATLCQQERVSAGWGLSEDQYHESRMWSEGLISSAKNVAGAVAAMVQAADASCKGEVEEFQLVASSNQVASTTAQLVAASGVSLRADSANQRNLESASLAVRKATQALVSAAQASGEKEEEQVAFGANLSFVQARKAEMDQMASILRLQKELETARQGLFQLRNKEYKAKPSDALYEQ